MPHKAALPISENLRPAALALAGYVLIASIIAWPTLAGRGVIGPDILLDWDPLYAKEAGPVPPLPPVADYTPIVLDYPRDLAFAQGLHAGRLDNWNPLVACGTHLWAEQGGPFFPLKLPFYLYPSRVTYDVFLALRLVLAGFGAYLLARATGRSPLGAFAAGASFELSGILIAQLAFAAASPTYVLPWVVLGGVNVTRRPGARAAALAAIALGLAGNGGHPTLALLDFVAFAIVAAIGIASRWRHPRAALATAGWVSAAGALGLALAAPSLLPLAELTSIATSYKLDPEGLVIRYTAIARARAFLPLSLFAPRTMEMLLPWTNSLLPFGTSISLIGVIGALAGIGCRGLSGQLAALLVASFALALAPPGFGWVGLLPGLSLILPQYAWSLCALAMTQALGRAVEDAATPRAQRWLGGVLLVVLGLIATALLLSEQLPRFTATGLWLLLLLKRGGLTTLLIGPAIAVLAVAACRIAARVRPGRLAGGALATFVVLDQLTTVLPLTRQPSARSLSSPPSPAVRFLQKHLDAGGRMLAVPVRVGYPHTPMLFGLRDQRGVSALPVRRYRDYMQSIGADSATATIQATHTTASPLLDLAAVRYVVVTTPKAAFFRLPSKLKPEKPPQADGANRISYQDERVLIYENRAALPRVRIVHESVAVPDMDAARAAVRSAATAIGHAADGTFASTAILEPDARGTAPPVMSGGAQAQESARIVDESDPDRLLIEANLAEPGIVVVADTYDPGWKAWVDGEPTAIFPADLLFRAIRVEAGKHAIEFRYEPRSSPWSLAAFVLACVAVATSIAPRRAFAPASTQP